MIGDTLRRERERQELTVQDVEQGTSIRSIYIEALEKGEYSKLPGEVYAKGFVKNYANFLNLDGEALSKEFSVELSPPVAVEVVEGAPVVEPEVVQEVPRTGKTKITELHEPDIKLKHSGSSSNTNAWIVAAVLLIALFAGGFWYYTKNSPDTVANVTPPQQTEVTPPPVETPASAAIPQDGVNVQARFSDDCWTRVFVDGVYVYEGVPTAGQVLDWHGAESVTIRVGNASAISVSMNGQDFGNLGALGEVVERTYTR